MAIYRVNEGPFDRFGGRFNEIIDPMHFLGRSAFDIPWKKSFPPANIKRDNEAYHIELMVPGFTREELEITVERGVLIVKGKKELEVPEEKDEFICEEFDLESFERRFKLTNEHAENRIEAVLDNGILKIIFFEKRVPVVSEYKRIPVLES
ncbi:MAG: Hsp20/alpha crystallin family protein [Saprospiraceae bacterium]|nr:Hsp20/alpha crystallin family protein [Saprospiraceae bacterium]